VKECFLPDPYQSYQPDECINTMSYWHTALVCILLVLWRALRKTSRPMVAEGRTLGSPKTCCADLAEKIAQATAHLCTAISLHNPSYYQRLHSMSGPESSSTRFGASCLSTWHYVIGQRTIPTSGLIASEG
jgi:hypothetical protein